MGIGSFFFWEEIRDFFGGIGMSQREKKVKVEGAVCGGENCWREAVREERRRCWLLEISS